MTRSRKARPDDRRRMFRNLEIPGLRFAHPGMTVIE
jgi:hypothetical protein